MFNIITRTHNRPNGLRNVAKSLSEQTFTNFDWFIIVDDYNDYGYIDSVAEEFDIDYIPKPVNRSFYENQLKEDFILNNNSFYKLPHNLYFNFILDSVKTGWNIFLDDDDQLNDPHSLEQLYSIINNNENIDLIFFQMRFKENLVLPKSDIFNSKNKNIEIGQIGGSCFTYNSSKIKNVNWDGYKCGDFRFINKVRSKSSKEYWLETIITKHNKESRK